MTGGEYLSCMHTFGFIVLLCLLFFSCTDRGKEEQIAQQNAFLSTDAELFPLVTATSPLTTYALFPHADSVTSGALKGSTAHQPLVRVRMNAVALSALQHGRFPAGGSFADGSIIFKEIIVGGARHVYAVMYKDAHNLLAGNGWLWAEYEPNGNVMFPIRTRGVNCTGCHAREQGPQHDFVRTFERQR